MKDNQELFSDKQDKTNFMDIFNIINARMKVLYAIVIMFISVSLFLAKVFTYGIVNHLEEKSIGLYYFIPIAISTIFSFILFPIIIEIFYLYSSMRLTTIERIWENFKKSEKYDTNNEIDGQIFGFSFILPFFAFIFIVIFFEGFLSTYPTIFKRNVVVGFFLLFLSFMIAVCKIENFNRGNITKAHVYINMKLVKIEIKRNFKINISKIVLYALAFVICFVLFVFCYLHFIEIFASLYIGIGNLDLLMIERMREMLILFPIK